MVKKGSSGVALGAGSQSRMGGTGSEKHVGKGLRVEDVEWDSAAVALCWSTPGGEGWLLYQRTTREDIECL